MIDLLAIGLASTAAAVIFSTSAQVVIPAPPPPAATILPLPLVPPSYSNLTASPQQVAISPCAFSFDELAALFGVLAPPNAFANLQIQFSVAIAMGAAPGTITSSGLIGLARVLEGIEVA